MDAIEQKLYGLMEIAEQQQQLASTALAEMKLRQTELAKMASQLQTFMQKILPVAAAAASDGAIKAVKEALENSSQIATHAVMEACTPLLAGLAGVETQAVVAEAKLKNAVKWFSWRWAWVVGIAICGVLLITWSAIWWQRLELADLKLERDKVNSEVIAAQNTLAVLKKKTGGVRYTKTGNVQK